MSDPSTETVVHKAETPAGIPGRQRALPWIVRMVLLAFSLMVMRAGGVPLWVSIPAVLVVVVVGTLIVATRERGPLEPAWRDVALDDPALSPEVRAELARAAGEFQALGLELVGMAQATLPGGAPFMCSVAADDPRAGIRAAARVAEAEGRRPVRRTGVGFLTVLEDGRLTTLWDEFPVAPAGTGAALLPTTPSVARLYRVHLYRHAHASSRVGGPSPAATAAERARESDERTMGWFLAHGWVRPHADGSPRFTTRAAVLMVLTYLPPGRWLAYLRNRIAERALLARAGA